MEINHLNGIRSSYVETDRIKSHVVSAGDPTNTSIVFLHGNASAATIWEELMLDLSSDYYCIAPDLRGYGKTDPDQIIDATRGMMDWVDDLTALVHNMDLSSFHLVGHSLGGSVCWGVIPEIGNQILSVTLMAPGPPAGFGGIHAKEGISNNPDFSGSGAGVVNKVFANNLSKGLRDTDDEMFSPRAVMHRLFWRDGFQPEREEDLLTAMLQMHNGDKRYPGDHVSSDYWPGTAPGKFGPVNALSPKYNNKVADRLSESEFKPPLLWIHGDDDQIISNQSLSDPGYQGKAGFRNKWPGSDKFPPQPMVAQIRHALDGYKKNSGQTDELVINNCGHTPFLEQPDEVKKALREFLDKHN